MCAVHFTCISLLPPHNNFVRKVQYFYSSHFTDKETETQGVIICQGHMASRWHSWNLNPRAQAFPALKFCTSKNATDEQNTSVGAE